MIAAYGPYENIEPTNHPALLVTAGLHDPRVPYWEPAKWVAKLRATTTSTRPILFRTEIDSGHGGPSGRYDAWSEEAFISSFILDTFDLATQLDPGGDSGELAISNFLQSSCCPQGGPPSGRNKHTLVFHLKVYASPVTLPL